MANYIFLDIDGVLNNQGSIMLYHNTLGNEDYFDRGSLTLLSQLCELFNCKVVLSSSWRRGLNDDLTPKHLTTKYFDGSEEESQTARMIRLFKEYNIPLVGKTDTEHHADGKWDRAGQILRYVNKYLQPEDKWVIFDDDDVIGEAPIKHQERLEKHFIQTNFYLSGLSHKEIIKAIKIFEE